MPFRINFSTQERKRYKWRQKAIRFTLLVPLFLILSFFYWLYEHETEYELIQQISQQTTKVEKTYHNMEQMLTTLSHFTPLVHIPCDHASTIQHILRATTQIPEHRLIPRIFKIQPDGSWQFDMFHSMPPTTTSYAQEAERAKSDIVTRLPNVRYKAHWPARPTPDGGMQLHITLSGKMQISQNVDFQIPASLAKAWQTVQDHRKAMQQMGRPGSASRFNFIKRVFPGSNRSTQTHNTFLESVRTIISDLVGHPNQEISENMRRYLEMSEITDNPAELIQSILDTLKLQKLQNESQYQSLQDLQQEWEKHTKRRFCLQKSEFETLCKRRDILLALQETLPTEKQMLTASENFQALQALPKGWFSYDDHLKEQRPNELMVFLLNKYDLKNRVRFSFPNKQERNKRKILPATNPLFKAIEWQISLQGDEKNTTTIPYQDFIPFLQALEKAQGLFLPRSINLSFQLNNPSSLDQIQIRGVLPLFDMQELGSAFEIQAFTNSTGGTHGL